MVTLPHPEQPCGVDEVVDDVRAMHRGLRRLDHLPVSVRLVREIRAELLAAVHGGDEAEARDDAERHDDVRGCAATAFCCDHGSEQLELGPHPWAVARSAVARTAVARSCPSATDRLFRGLRRTRGRVGRPLVRSAIAGAATAAPATEHHDQFAAARDHLDAALALDPTFVLALLHRVGSSDDPDEVRAYVDAAASCRLQASEDEGRTIDTFRAFLLDRDHHRGSEVFLERYAALAPGEPRPHDSLGLLYLRQGRLEDAIRAFEAALARDARFAERRSNLERAHAARAQARAQGEARRVGADGDSDALRDDPG